MQIGNDAAGREVFRVELLQQRTGEFVFRVGDLAGADILQQGQQIGNGSANVPIGRDGIAAIVFPLRWVAGDGQQ